MIEALDNYRARRAQRQVLEAEARGRQTVAKHRVLVLREQRNQRRWRREAERAVRELA